MMIGMKKDYKDYAFVVASMQGITEESHWMWWEGTGFDEIWKYWFESVLKNLLSNIPVVQILNHIKSFMHLEFTDTTSNTLFKHLLTALPDSLDFVGSPYQYLLPIMTWFFDSIEDDFSDQTSLSFLSTLIVTFIDHFKEPTDQDLLNPFISPAR